MVAEYEDHEHYFVPYVVAPTAMGWGYTMYHCDCGADYVDSYVAPTGGNAVYASAKSPKTDEGAQGAWAAVFAAALCGAPTVVCGFGVRRKAQQEVHVQVRKYRNFL